MKNKYLYVLVLLVCIAFAGLGLTGVYVTGRNQAEEQRELTVVTSFYPMYLAADNVIGDSRGVELQNLSEPQTGCLHDYQLTPEDMKLLSEADVFIVNGGGIETFLTDVAKAYPDLVIINASENIHLLEDNAHAWMNPEMYVEQVKEIAAGLKQADPDHGALYEQNTAAYCEKIGDLQQEFEDLKAQFQGKNIVIFHEAYAYVVQALGMNVSGSMDLDEERQVSAGEVAEILSVIESQNVSFVFAERLYGESMGNTVEAESGVRVIYLDPLTRGEYRADGYLEGMQKNLELIKEAFSDYEL